jgi:hypothetical protein
MRNVHMLRHHPVDFVMGERGSWDRGGWRFRIPTSHLPSTAQNFVRAPLGFECYERFV